MFGRRIELFRLFGFAVRIDLSWFVLAVLITWSLATGFFPGAYEGLSRGVYWLMGAAGALGLFVSVVLHELGHSFVARRHGIEMKGITLFIFGGVAEMSDEPPSPKAEFLVAAAGPAVSLALAGLCLAGGLAAGDALPPAAAGVVRYLGVINLMLVAFNVVPAFPLDGGRVLRSLLWHWKGDLRWATGITSRIGSAFGIVLILLGVVSILAGNFVGGMWWALIGLFLRGAAQTSYDQLLLRQFLSGEPVRRFMHDAPVTVPRSISVAELVEKYFYRHPYKMFPVVDGDRPVGCVTLHAIKELPREEWDRQTVGSLAEPCGEENSTSPDEDALAAFARMSRSGNSRLMVIEDGRLVGILTLKDLVQFFARKLELESSDERASGAGGSIWRGDE